ncbi:MAG TPA: response regulator [Steroidobacteraceae bacterium]|nr:response regulator [Steroidobacteraceae bacterium]HRX90949.1 response regulator [Steroidobacteraceae bacterium]
MASVLIIDDEPDVSHAIERVMTRAGYQVTVANTAEEGMDMYTSSPTDIVITDIIMPRQHGISVIKSIRESVPRARIIAISGGGNFAAQDYQPNAITTTAYLAAAKKAGADVVLTKPFDKQELLETVTGLLQR